MHKTFVKIEGSPGIAKNAWGHQKDFKAFGPIPQGTKKKKIENETLCKDFLFYFYVWISFFFIST